MANLALCIREEKKSRPPTEDEIIDITRAAQGVRAIIHVMAEYACNKPNGEDNDTLGIFGCVFHVLELFMEPITDYLFEYGGKPSAPEKEEV